MSIETRCHKLAIVGCGRAAAGLHLPALQKIPTVRITAIADADEHALNEVADRFGVRQRFKDLVTLLERADADIVAVCVPAEHHVELALQVLRAGRHLFVEKPLALDLAGCDRLLRAASDSASQVMVGFNLRFHRLVQEATAFIASGQLGPIEAISSTWTSAIRFKQTMPEWRDHRTRGGGALFEIAVHHFDLWRHLLATEISSIHAVERTSEWQDGTVAISAQLADGVVATGLFSERSSDGNEIRIYGRNGLLKVTLTQYDGLEFIPIDSEPGMKGRLAKLPGMLASIPQGLALMRQGGDYLLSYQHEWRHFLDSITHGKASAPQASLEDGRAAVKAVLAAIESHSTGQPVVL